MHCTHCHREMFKGEPHMAVGCSNDLICQAVVRICHDCVKLALKMIEEKVTQ